MPKQKTSKSLAKRVKVTKTGKVKRRKSGKGHLLTGKNANRRRKLPDKHLTPKTGAQQGWHPLRDRRNPDDESGDRVRDFWA